LIGAVALIFLAGGYWIYSVVNDDSVPRRRVMEVVALKIIEPPPPPPKVEPPPEPPKVIEEQIIEPPVDAPPDEAPPQEAPPEGPIGLDAQGGAGGDAFGLAARPGGRDFLIGNNRGGGGGNRFGRYATLIQSQIDKSLRGDEMLEAARFRTTMRIWLTASGAIERVELARTTGDAELDQRIARVISNMPAISEAPPSEMPQPVIVRIGATPGFG
jgi:hypothetical protein